MLLIHREAAREAAIRALEGKLRAPGRLVAAALVEPGRNGHGRGLQGQGLALEEPEPWPEPVDGAALLTDLTAAFRRFVVLPDGAAEAMALWTVHTHALEAAAVSPLLVLSSPEKRCGKTTALTVLASLVPRALPTSNVTPAALFCTVEASRPTLLVDEADSFLRMRDELRGILNSGHTRSAAFVVRTVGDDYEPRRFTTWAAKALALIGQLPETLEDRAIVVPMRRRAPGEEIERLRQDRTPEELKPLCRQTARWKLDHTEALRAADPPIPPELHDRAADNWRPLLAIADQAGGRWPEVARHTALLLSAGKEGREASVRIDLLSDLREIFDQVGRERLFTEEILNALHERDDRPWSEWSRQGKPLHGPTLARLLRPFGITPRLLRVGETVRRGYQRGDFEDAFRRYLPPA